MDFLTSFIYGIIQGITEFLPVSSSGHLALLPDFLKINDPGVVFDLAMHVGTAFAIMIYFKKDISVLFKSFFRLMNKNSKDDQGRFFVLNMMVSTVITFIIVMAIKGWATEFGRSAKIIAINLVIFGILMFLSDWRRKGDDKISMQKSLQLPRAIMIGFFQALAIFPGVSRSGATMTISRWMGLTRTEASRYSFLLSLPVIFGGIIFKLPDFFKSGRTFDISSCLFGGLISFIVGIVTIHFFLKFIERVGLGVFSVYRLILAALIFILISV